jgi:hypothetical protein
MVVSLSLPYVGRNIQMTNIQMTNIQMTNNQILPCQLTHHDRLII